MKFTLAERANPGKGPRLLPLAFGFFCAWAQLTLLKDFLDLTGGRALWVGWFLGVWLIAGGIPALISRRIRDESISPWTGMLIGVSVVSLPFISLILQWLPEKLTTHPGIPVPLLSSLGLGAGIAGVQSFLLGFLFLAVRSRITVRDSQSRTAALYAIETAGFAIGAILFLATSGVGEHLTRALIAGAIVPAAFLADVLRPRFPILKRGDLIAAGLTFIPLVILLFITPQVESEIITDRYADLGQARKFETPYGRLIRIDAEWNRSFYRDGSLLFTTDDYDYAEEMAHLVILQHPIPKDILILGLGSDRLPFEAMKYPGSRITLVEQDAKLISQWKELHADEIDSGGISIIRGDPREFMEANPGEFDLIIYSRVDPSDLSSNRLLTVEGLKAARRALREGGVLGLGLEAEENYSGHASVLTSATVYFTLRELFENVHVTPLYANIFVAGDNDYVLLDPAALAYRMEKTGIEGTFLNRYTIFDRLPTDRMEALTMSFSKIRVGVNSDLNPLAFRAAYQVDMLRESWQIAKTYERLTREAGFLQIGLLILFSAMGFLYNNTRTQRGRASIAETSARLLMGGELILILLWQNVGGGLVSHVAVITTTAMVGAALGAWAANRGNIPASGWWIGILERILVLEMITLIASMLLLPSVEWLSSLIILIFALLIPATVGYQFTLLCRLTTSEGHSDAPLYGWDLVGASFGAILLSFFFLPLASYPIILLLLTAPKFFSAVRK